MLPNVQLSNYNEFDSYTKTIESNGPPVYFYFSGSKNSDGKSWCPDCVVAEPVVQAYLDELNKSLIFAYVDVGDVKYWRDVKCPFRTDSRLKLMQIPTIIKWNGVKRLEGSQCSKRELLQMMFEEDEE